MTSESMPIEDYLAQGGKLSAPENAPARLRGELLRLMASFVDSELAASAGFASIINDAPGIRSRIAAARIVLEKAAHAERVLTLMGNFGADTARYQVHLEWTARIARDADLGASRSGSDMRLSVFHYPLAGWDDAVVMNVLMGLATQVQLAEMMCVSYTPLAEVIREIAAQEAQHTKLGFDALPGLAEARKRDSARYWMPRVAATFGAPASARFDTLKRLGLRHRTNEDLLAEWRALVPDDLT